MKNPPVKKAKQQPPALDDAELGRQLTAQYHRATGAMVEILAFGAMLGKVRDHLELVRVRTNSGNKGPIRGGESSLAAWLKQHAPEISKPTAYRFLTLAEGVRRECQLGVKVDLVELLTTDPTALPKPLQAKRKKVMALVDGKSQRQLLFDFGVAEPKRGTNNPEGGRTHKKFRGEDPDATPDIPPEEKIEMLRETDRSDINLALDTLVRRLLRGVPHRTTEDTKQIAAFLRDLAKQVETGKYHDNVMEGRT